MGANLFQRSQAARGDGAGYLTLAYAIAAADFRVVRKGGNRGQRIERRGALVCLPEDQCVPHRRDVGALLLQVVEPGAIGRVAVEDRADNPVVFQHDPLVDACGGISQDDFLTALSLGEIAERIEIDPRDLQLGRGVGMDEGWATVAGETGRRDPRHLVERGHEAVDLPCHFCTFPDCEDVAVGRLHARIDDNASVDGKPCVSSERHVRTDANRHDDQRGANDAVVVERDAFNPALANDRLGISFADNLDAPLLDRLLQEIARGRIELPLHQGRHNMEDGDIHAAMSKTRCGFQSEQSATDHHRLLARLCGKQHGVDIVQVAVGNDAWQIVSRHRDDEWNGTGCYHQLVIGLGNAVIGSDGFSAPINRDDPMPLVEGDAVVDVPAIAMNDDLLIALLSRQHRREHDAIVVHTGFRVEDGHIVSAGRLLEEMLQHPSGGHSVADDDELLGRGSHGLSLVEGRKRKNAARRSRLRDGPVLQNPCDVDVFGGRGCCVLKSDLH